MTCSEFRASRFDGSDTTPELLEHLRECDACMNFAGEKDGDFLFKALGGDDMIPPGGIDVFVGDVMRQIEVRDTERRLVRTHRPASRYAVALAAALGLIAVSYTLVWQNLGSHPVTAPSVAAINAPSLRSDIALPVVEEYDNSAATIVEVPSSNSDDVKIVMIFDESLPADL